MNLKKLLKDSNFISFDYDVPGSRIFLPAGWKLRKLLYEWLSCNIQGLEYEEIHLPNFISSIAIDKLKEIHVPPDYFYLSNGAYLAATHEAGFFTFAKKYLLQHSLPYRVFNLGSAYRRPKNAKSPYNFGERNSFLEFYFIDKDKDKCYAEISKLNDLIAECIMDRLTLPSINVKRPVYGNYGFSNATYTVETHLHEGRTLTSGMIYDQGEKFTKVFGLSTRKKSKFSVHGAFTDNILYAYLSNCRDAFGFILHSWLSPKQVLLCLPLESSTCNMHAKSICDELNYHGIRYEIVRYKNQPHESIRNRFLLQGIPVSITLNERNSNISKLLIYLRINPNEPIKTKFNFQFILDAFADHDEFVNRLMLERRNNCVVTTSSLDEAREAIGHGMIAACYLQSSDSAVQAASEIIQAGEILGFDLRSDQHGRCVLNNKRTGHMCYISRRV